MNNCEKTADKSIQSGRTASSTAAAITYAQALQMIASLTTDDFVNEHFVMARELYYHLLNKDRGTDTGRYFIDDRAGNSINGIPAHPTSDLPVHSSTKHDIVYGDWNGVYVGFYTGLRLMADPYTAGDDGEIKMRFSRLGDVIADPYRFKSFRNVSLA